MANEDLELKVGDPLMLVPVGTDSGTRYNVRVVGYFAPRSILVTTPRTNGNPLLVKDGQVFGVRLKVENRVVGFSTHVVKVAHAPFPYLHLQFPSEIEELVTRREPRVDIRQVVAVLPAGSSGAGVAALLCDLSVTGARLSCASELAAQGTRLTIVTRFVLAGGKREVSLTGIVRNVTHVENDGDDGTDMWHHGIEFADVGADTALVLQAVLYDRLFNAFHAA